MMSVISNDVLRSSHSSQWRGHVQCVIVVLDEPKLQSAMMKCALKVPILMVLTYHRYGCNVFWIIIQPSRNDWWRIAPTFHDYHKV